MGNKLLKLFKNFLQKYYKNFHKENEYKSEYENETYESKEVKKELQFKTPNLNKPPINNFEKLSDISYMQDKKGLLLSFANNPIDAKDDMWINLGRIDYNTIGLYNINTSAIMLLKTDEKISYFPFAFHSNTEEIYEFLLDGYSAILNVLTNMGYTLEFDEKSPKNLLIVLQNFLNIRDEYLKIIESKNQNESEYEDEYGGEYENEYENEK